MKKLILTALFLFSLILLLPSQNVEIQTWFPEEISENGKALFKSINDSQAYLDSLGPDLRPKVRIPTPTPSISYSIRGNTGVLWVHAHSTSSRSKKKIERNPEDPLIFVSNIRKTNDNRAKFYGPGLDFVMIADTPEQATGKFAKLLARIKASWGKEMTWGEIIFRLESTAMNVEGKYNSNLGYGQPDFLNAGSLRITETPLKN